MTSKEKVHKIRDNHITTLKGAEIFWSECNLSSHPFSSKPMRGGAVTRWKHVTCKKCLTHMVKK